MTNKVARPERPYFAVLPPAPSLRRVWRIGPAQASIIVGPGRRGRRNWYQILLFLAVSCVGSITVVDHDNVEVYNLHWHVIHTKGRRGTRKARSAHDTVRDLNPTVLVTAMTDPLTWDNTMELVRGNDCVMDISNNPRTRYLINDA